MMKKKDSEAWCIAKKITRRKHSHSIPVALSDDGQRVQFMSRIRGNTWWYTLRELRLLEKRR